MKRGIQPRVATSLGKRKDSTPLSFEEEFQTAENYFTAYKKKCPNRIPTKMPKQRPDLHAFIRFEENDEIVRLANKKLEGTLGEGNFGVVVRGIKRDRSECAIKIEAEMKRDPKDKQVKLMKRIGFHLGETQRKLIKKKKFKGKLSQYRRYTMYALLKGKELKKQLATLNEDQKIIVALKCCEALMYLHKKRIIHCDIKPENFIAQILGNDITVKPCDYDFSMLLPREVEYLELDHWCGTKEYQAPEINKNLPLSTFSFAADIYSLGIIFQKDLGLPSHIFSPMIQKNRLDRCSLAEVHENLSDYYTAKVVNKFSKLNLNSDSSLESQDFQASKKRKRRNN